MISKAIDLTSQFLRSLNISENIASETSVAILIIAIIFCAVLCYNLLQWIVTPLIYRITARTSVKWDDIILRPKFLRRVWMLIAVIICYRSIPIACQPFPTAQSIAVVMMQISLIISLMLVVIEIIKTLFLVFDDHENVDVIATRMRMAQDNGEVYEYKPSHSLKGLQQMLIGICIAVCCILIISILMNKNPVVVFTGLGAGATVLMLVFKDSILGVVAGVQLTINDMLQPGDWIEVPKYGANGIVREVTLATVKVQNWDKTIITIPPYSLVSEGFQNWRGMQASGGRRIMRSINIDMSSIRFCTDEEKAAFASMPWTKNIDMNGEVVNLTVFRHYLEWHVINHETTRTDMLFMIRELQPGPNGLPLEIYFFTSCTDWKIYEGVQSNLLDFVIATLPKFGLRTFQAPTGLDIQQLSR